MVAGLLGLTAQATPWVPGFDRLVVPGTPPTAEAGQVLASELSCLACHGSAETPRSAWKQGPDLSAVGDRVRASYLREFLLDPAKAKPGTTMPNLLAGQPEAQRTELAEDLTHYLMQRRSKAPATLSGLTGSAEKGAELYNSVGCVACHSGPFLDRVGDKYAPGQLAHFLEHPLLTRPAGRMPDLHLSSQEAADLAAHLAKTPAKDEPAFAVDAARVQRGEAAFQKLGCVSCHGEAPASKPSRELKADRGCLAETPGAGVPHYALTTDQRSALRLALATPETKPEPKLAIRQAMLQHNCFACHSRDGLGGPGKEVSPHFHSSKDDLGDLGRLPPPLDGVGRKLQLPALENILRGEGGVRKYMKVRMGDFGDDFARHFSKLLATTDADPNETPTLAVTDPRGVGRNAEGRLLVGLMGYACITCHDLHGHASLGIGAYDMAEMPKRLRPEWVRDFLINPVNYPTGTRMPSFWPNGKPSNPKLGGNAFRQIDSIRVYLTEVDQSLPPEGFFDPAAFELKPAEQPIIFRTFIKGAGTHSIAVGMPGGLNAAFDTATSRWALAWHGRFLNADGTWNQRVAKMEDPLGEKVTPLAGIGKLTIEGQDTITEKYLGYRVGKDGLPTFLYTLGKLQVEDRVSASANGLRRTVRVTGQTQEKVLFQSQPAPGLNLRLINTPAAPLLFEKGATEIIEEISW